MTKPQLRKAIARLPFYVEAGEHNHRIAHWKRGDISQADIATVALWRLLQRAAGTAGKRKAATREPRR